MCKVCSEEKPLLKDFERTGAHRRRECTKCRSKKRYYSDPASCRRYRRRHVAQMICKDSRKSDRKAQRANDLTPAFVEGLITQDCPSCGESKLRMTVDRVDNAKGHTQDNVVPACVRCNLVRGAMPWRAWKLLWPALREARETGLFGSWAGPRHGYVADGENREEEETTQVGAPCTPTR